MTAPIRIAPEYELFRVITDYEALQDGFLDRIDDLDTTIIGVELAAEMASGQLQKCLTKSAGKHVKETARSSRKASLKRTFGWETLGKTLEKTGLALVLVVDDERFAPIKELLAKRRRRVMPTNVSITRPTWLFTKKKAREMRALGVSKLSPKQRKKIARIAANARWKAGRIREKRV